MNIRTVRKEYDDYLFLDLRLSSLTRETYGREIERFVDYLIESNIDIKEVSSLRITNYLTTLHKQGLTPVTIAKVLSSIRSFFRFLNYEGYRKDNPTDKIEPMSLDSSLPGVLSLEETDRFLDSIPLDSIPGLRDRTMFEIIYSCGLRISEALNITMGNLFFDDALIRVTGKRDKDRLVPFGSKAEYWLKKYLKEGRVVLVKQEITDDHLFLSIRGRKLSRKSIWKRFHEYTLLSGIDAKVHTLRHSFATHLIQGGADLRVVQELLGHSSITTTQVYTHIQNKDLQVNHDTFHPLNEVSSEEDLRFLSSGKVGVL